MSKIQPRTKIIKSKPPELTPINLAQKYEDVIDQIKRVCKDTLRQYGKDDPQKYFAWRDLKDEYKDIPAIQAFLNTYRLAPSKPKGISSWLSALNTYDNDLSKIFIVMNYIFGHALGRKRGIAFLDKHHCKNNKFIIKGAEKDYVVFYCEDYAKVLIDLAHLGLTIKKQMLWAYIRWMIRDGVIQAIGRNGRNGNRIYAVGYWNDRKGGTRKVLFYQMKEKREAMIEAFANFDLWTYTL